MRSLFAVCQMPPPVHGMSLINAAMLEKMREKGADISLFNISPKHVGAGFGSRVRLLSKVALVAVHLPSFFFRVLFQRPDTLYLSLAGGFGQIFELPFLAVARFLGMRIYVHHHSFAYIHRRSRLGQTVFRICGYAAKHLVLCNDMAHRLCITYGIPRDNTTVISNSAFFNDSSATRRARSRVKTIGFLGNISFEKGIKEFLGAVSMLAEEGCAIEAVIAGPFFNPETEAYVMEALQALPNARYVGPKYGPEKSVFFNNIDILLFPTKYVNEAEPLTIFEALVSGVPVLAWERGCIEDVIGRSGGRVFPQSQDFVPSAVKSIMEWVADPSSFQKASEEALSRFTYWKELQDETLDELLSEMCG